jgi:DNA-binding response OmpR family regulator
MARILVINDTQELLEMFRFLLESEGYEVTLSGMPILRVSEIEQLQPDLIILDIVFGDRKTGWQMLQMLKMQRSTSSIPVIVCTAALREVQEQEGHLISQGIRVIYKPFDIDMLLTIIKQALEPSQGSAASQA